MIQKINYSIIIPHHNIPILLQRCLDSIPRRNDLEIIVVDDNSDFDKIDINSFPGITDPSVKILFTKEGKGAGYARNVGLSQAQGKWLFFVDADDFFCPNFFEKVDEHLESEFDIIFYSIACVDTETLESNSKVDFLSKYIEQYNKSNKVEYLFRYAFPQPWSKMVRAEFVRNKNIQFDETKVANDYGFSVQIGYYAKSIKIDANQLYCYTVRSNSLSSAICDTRDKLEARLYVYFRVHQFFKHKHVKFKEKYLYGLVTGLYFNNKEFFRISYKYLRQNNIGNCEIISNMIKSFFHLAYIRVSKYCLKK